MARTVQQVVTRAREILQDDSGVRYTDPQLVAHTLDALEQIRMVRPDLFIGQFTVPLPDAIDLSMQLPVPDNLFAAIGQYVSGAAELRDDEFAVDGRAMTLQAALAKKLIGGL